ncbi:MAG: hypothetical protein ABL907_20580 [Hyphomicrobium sp.]
MRYRTMARTFMDFSLIARVSIARLRRSRIVDGAVVSLRADATSYIGRQTAVPADTLSGYQKPTSSTVRSAKRS